MAPRLEVRNVSLKLHNKNTLQNVSLQLEPGCIASILGPSGCGKTTLLRA
ncbi:MAG: ATP-binding cassette domain-containing protein, partial [Proteobacteria bacterium]|nr:ATP-binding cassette domain-containing protein [Pseudomonadota bacterium]